MKSQQLLPSIIYKNYNASKLVQRESKTKKVESKDLKAGIAESSQKKPTKS